MPPLLPRELAEQTIARLYRHWSKLPASERQTFQSELDQLQSLLESGHCLTLAAFGLVNRGKSAVINALLGQPVFEVGPINGVTHSTHRIQWGANPEQVVELLDTPGLNEVEGEVRAQLAWSAAQQADLILFVIAGDLTQIEYQALLELRTLQKPILLVFNKIDLYPDHDRAAIYAQITSPQLRQLVSPDEILMVAADPKPNQVRIHWPNGAITHEWEHPHPQIEPLRSKLQQVLSQEGGSLSALNALVRAGSLQDQLLSRHQATVKNRIQRHQWRALGIQSLAVGICPIGGWDLGIMAAVNLGLVAQLSRDQHGSTAATLEAYRALLKPLGLGLGILAAINLGSGLGWPDLVLGSPAWVGSGLIQAVASGWWTHQISQSAQQAFQKGSRWGRGSPRAAIKTLLKQLVPQSILCRLKDEVQDQLGDPQGKISGWQNPAAAPSDPLGT